MQSYSYELTITNQMILYKNVTATQAHCTKIQKSEKLDTLLGLQDWAIRTGQRRNEFADCKLNNIGYSPIASFFSFAIYCTVADNI